MKSEKTRVLSGMRPTGPLHIGHLFGVLKTWKELQEEYDCFYFIADWHALTTEYQTPGKIVEYSKELFLEWLSVGITPEKSTIFLQSEVKEHAELFLLFSMFVPVPWLERNPTYKDMLQNLKDKELNTYGFLGYPVLQAVDILIYKAKKVPVGLDQLPHLELTREIARRFNYLYKENFFPEPEPILSQAPKIPGIDGRKMSKSYGNAIFLTDSEKEVREKVLSYVTDIHRPRKSDPGDPENRCIAFNLMKVLYPKETLSEIIEGCKKAQLGCKECKKRLAERVIEFLMPVWEKRKALEKDPWQDYLKEGIKKAREVTRNTLDEVKNLIFGKSLLD